MFAKCVICSIVDYVRYVSLLSKPQVRFIVVRKGKNNLVFIPYMNRNYGKLSFPESKHNTQ
jgi:hypothetical protein